MRLELKNFQEALSDFEKAKELDSNTKNIDKNIEDLKKKMADEATEEQVNQLCNKLSRGVDELTRAKRLRGEQ